MIQFACPKCGRSIRVSDSAAGQKGKCKDCGNVVMIPTPQPQHVAPPQPIVVVQQPAHAAPVITPAPSSSEKTLYHAHPSMFRNRPIWFLICVALIAAYGAGLLLLFIWWFRCHCTTLTVTNKRTTLRHGFFSKHITEIMHRDVRNISVGQSLMQRIFGCGAVEVSSSGQAGVEISVVGMRSPYKIKSIVDAGR